MVGLIRDRLIIFDIFIGCLKKKNLKGDVDILGVSLLKKKWLNTVWFKNNNSNNKTFME